MTYTLNDGPERPLIFHSSAQQLKSLCLSGIRDFVICKIDPYEFEPSNRLRISAFARGGSRRTQDITHSTTVLPHPDTAVHLDLRKAERAQKHCQSDEGRWHLIGDENGRPCMRISPGDTCLDRLALFTQPIVASAYTLTMRLRVDRWLRGLHNAGLVFGWRGHRSGDRHNLPQERIMGLGYYYSHCPGFWIQLGENARYQANGRKVGNRILAEGPLSRARAMLSRATRPLMGGMAMRQPGTCRDYWFRVEAKKDCYTFSVGPADRPQPPTQLNARNEGRPHPPGARGVVAHFRAVNVYGFCYEIDRGTRA